MLQGYGHLLGKSIHSHGKGEVRHGKNGTSLGRTRGIEMMGMQRHGANGMAWLRQADLTSGSLRGKSVGSKSRTDLLQCWHKAFLPFRQCYVFSCIKLAQASARCKGARKKIPSRTTSFAVCAGTCPGWQKGNVRAPALSNARSSCCGTIMRKNKRIRQKTGRTRPGICHIITLSIPPLRMQTFCRWISRFGMFWPPDKPSPPKGAFLP